MTGTICQSTNLVPLRGENEFKPQQQNEILVLLGSTVDYENKRKMERRFGIILAPLVGS